MAKRDEQCACRDGEGQFAKRELKSRQQYEARARIAKALAHPTRLLIVDAVTKSEMCVADLARLAGADQSTVSNHLAILRQTGLVARRRMGLQTLYRIRAESLEGFWKCLEGVLKQNLEEQREALGG